MPASELADSLFDTQLRIIAENDTYAVIQMRIPKQVIRDNVPFFGALIDLAPAPAPALVNCRRRR